jgi:hypothetical protein
MSPDDSALDAHIVFFDVDGDGSLTRPEIHRALRELGFSHLAAVVLAPLLSAALPKSVDALSGVRHDDSGTFTSDGKFDEDAFEAWWHATDSNASKTVTRWELLCSSLRITDDASSLVASIGEFQLVYSLLAENGGLSRKAIEDFLNGDLFRRLMAQRST